MKRKIQDNLRRISDRIANACIRADRDPSEITTVIVTKYVGIDAIRTLLDIGCRELGESQVQELTHRAAMIAETSTRRAGTEKSDAAAGLRWHMVGHLQRNKVKALLPFVDLIHSVDSLRLAEEIDAQAQKIGKRIDVLMQVNAAGETQKFGLAIGAVPHLIEQVKSLPNLRVCGLMTMAPLSEDKSRVAWTFERTQELFAEIRSNGETNAEFRQLSMGMSGDFETAIEHGATIIRIGSAVFDGVVSR